MNQNKPYVIILLPLVFFVIFLRGTQWTSHFWANLGFISINQVWNITTTHNLHVVNQTAANYFKRAWQKDSNNSKSYWFWRLAQLKSGNKISFSDGLPVTITQSKEAAQLAEIALNDMNDIDAAFLWLASAASIDNYRSWGNLDSMGKLCQRQYASRSERLPWSQLICDNYWYPDNLNLIINGQFEQGTLGWAGLTVINEDDASIMIYSNHGFPAPSLQIHGKTDSYHGGWFQRLYLPANATIKFQARIKTESVDDLRVETLIWQLWQSDQPANYFETITHSQDWTLYEHTITLAVSKNQMLLLAPVRVWGIGTVWVDDVIVTIVEN